MATELILTLPYPPAGTTGNHAVKHARGGHYLTDAARAFIHLVKMSVSCQNGRRMLEGPLEVVWTVSPPDRRARDSDNVMKTVKDCLTRAGVWVDDSNKVIRREVFQWTEPVERGLVTLRVIAYGGVEIA